MSRPTSPMRTEPDGGNDPAVPLTSGAVAVATDAVELPPPTVATTSDGHVDTTQDVSNVTNAGLAAPQPHAGTAHRMPSLFAPTRQGWSPRYPLLPAMLHAPGTCVACDSWAAHLPQSEEQDPGFVTAAYNAFTQIHLQHEADLVQRGWVQGGRELAEQQRRHVESMEQDLWRARDEVNHLLTRIRDVEEALHDTRDRLHASDDRVGRRDRTIEQLERDVERLRREIGDRQVVNPPETKVDPELLEPRDGPTGGPTTTRPPPPPPQAIAPPPTPTSTSHPSRPTMPRVMNDWADFSGSEGDSDDDDDDPKEERRRIDRGKSRMAMNKGKGKQQEGGQPQFFGGTGAPPAAPEGWPVGVQLPQNSVIAMAERWFNFIPRSSRDARRLIDAARRGDETAVVRARDLVTQANRDGALRGVNGIYTLVSNWQPPRNVPAAAPMRSHGETTEQDERDLRQALLESREEARRRAAAAPTGSTGAGPSGHRTSAATSSRGRGAAASSTRMDHGAGRQTGSTRLGPTFSQVDGQSQSTKRKAESPAAKMRAPPTKKAKKLPQPTNQSSIEDWQEWYATYPRNILSSMRVGSDGVPEYDDVAALHTARRIGPHLGRYYWEVAVAQLFSIEGLYGHVVQLGNYPIGDVTSTVPYPWTGANSTIFDVARWFAASGYQPHEVQYLERYFIRRRNEHERRGLEEGVPFTTFPTSPGDVHDEDVPRIDQLPVIPSHVRMPTADVAMGAAVAGETPQPSTAGTPADETHPTEDRADQQQ
ncbi:uncharacterized protein C8Q71DRAFT_852275 [Rhodofomes roseus]|uniref:Uncharacterized protein n=1 Tax=Rhodofomes roseus TaxID=34475 RepID=A0ABQ8KWS5_9APHY|nr:uncharacterized protein C8Q71DRAFT_852275 [Rhodofomes roseus]KAH9843752.1 hypothetical protein C8Q71DRAFT_852275 [Rhodofomes roseus]